MADARLTALTETSVPALDDWLYSVDLSDTTDDAAGSSRKLSFNRLLGIAPSHAGGRLTTESGASVSDADRTSQGTLYYTPHLYDGIRIYDGTRVRLMSFSEINVALSGLGFSSGVNYDAWLYLNGSSLDWDFTAWSTATARATAIAWQSGLGWVKSGAATRLYAGTIRTTSTTAVEDSAAKRFLWNTYNKVHRPVYRFETTASWTYTTDTYRQANANAANQIELVAGMAGSAMSLSLAFRYGNSTAAAIGCTAAISEDSTTGPAAMSHVSRPQTSGIANSPVVGSVSLAMTPALGYHYYAWLERSTATGTGTFYGTNGSSPEIIRCGLNGTWEC